MPLAHSSNGTELSDLIAGALRNCRVGMLGAPEISADQLVASVDLSPVAAVEGTGLAAYLTNDLHSVALILACIVHRVPLVSLPPYRRATAAHGLLSDNGGSVSNGDFIVVARDDIAAALRSSGGARIVAHSELARTPLRVTSAGEFVLHQHSSGTTALPKVVDITDSALAMNIIRMLEVIEPDGFESVFSWLPLGHDLGLVGMVLTLLTSANERFGSGGRLTLATPEWFVRRPGRWMAAVAECKATITAAPDFAFRMAARAAIGSPDLSTLRCAISGGELVRPSTLRSFETVYGPAGLRPTALCPAYGMAELGLAACISSPRIEWNSALVDVDGAAIDAVSCGPPLRGYDVVTSSPPGTVGEILIKTPHLVAAGDDIAAPVGDSELRAPQPKQMRKELGRLSTGDIGVVLNGDVFPLGRGGDLVVANGRWVHAPSIEAVASAVPGVAEGRVACVNSAGGLVLMFERSRSRDVGRDELPRIESAVARAFGIRLDEVIPVPRGTIPFTTSGKLRRQTAAVMAAKLRGASSEQ